MRLLVLSFILLIFTFEAKAQDSIQIISKASHNVRLLKKIAMPSGDFVYVTVRDEGHVLGQNFIVQLRASCNGDVEDFTNLAVIDSLSVCNLKPESVKINKNLTAVAFLSKTANINKYYEDISNGENSPKVDCNLKTEIQKFSLRKVCSQ